MRFAPAIFVSAFLLFQVQPLVSKHILPWYGGTPAVWTTCLLVFQSLLFFGYVYAHLSTTRLDYRWQPIVHMLLLVAAAFVTVLPGNTWKPQGTEYPVLRIVTMLLMTVGLPFFVLAASGPLFQTWFAGLHQGRSPYRLFAISNAGSLIALLSYPFVIEPALAIKTQARIWWFLYLAFVVLCGAIAWRVWRSTTTVATPKAGVAPISPHRNRKKAVWGTAGKLATALRIGWAACGVILFMSVTNHLTLDIAPVPFLWVMPLSIYLLSFIVAFSGARWYQRGVFAALSLVRLLPSMWFLGAPFLGMTSRSRSGCLCRSS